MSVVVEVPTGGLYIYRGRQSSKVREKAFEFLVRATQGDIGAIHLNSVYCPSKLVGKKLRFKVEIVEEK